MTPLIHSFPVWLPQTQTWMFTQVRFLPSGWRPHVVCARTENLEQFGVSDLHVLRDRSRLGYYWDRGLIKLRLRRYSGWLLEQCRAIGPALLHSHFGNIGWHDMWVARGTGVPQVVGVYGVDATRLPLERPKWRARYRELFGSVAAVLCEGPHMAATIEALGCPPAKIRVQHLGVDLERIAFAPRRWTPGRPLRVLIAGSFREKKGIPYAIRALGRIARELPLEVTVIGDADRTRSSRAEKRHILRAIDEAGLRDRVRLLGYQPYARLIAEAAAHHVFLSPSVTAADGDTEGGLPVAVIEMAASGMPVVATRHCDIPEMIEHGVTGLLAEERDVDGLADCLRRLIAAPDSWAPMAEAARRRAEAEFDARRQGERLGAIYRAVLEDSGRAAA